MPLVENNPRIISGGRSKVAVMEKPVVATCQPPVSVSDGVQGLSLLPIPTESEWEAISEIATGFALAMTREDLFGQLLRRWGDG